MRKVWTCSTTVGSCIAVAAVKSEDRWMTSAPIKSVRQMHIDHTPLSSKPEVHLLEPRRNVRLRFALRQFVVLTARGACGDRKDDGERRDEDDARGTETEHLGLPRREEGVECHQRQRSGPQLPTPS